MKRRSSGSAAGEGITHRRSSSRAARDFHRKYFDRPVTAGDPAETREIISAVMRPLRDQYAKLYDARHRILSRPRNPHACIPRRDPLQTMMKLGSPERYFQFSV